MPEPVNQEMPITFILPVRVVNIVLAALSKQPLEQVLEAFIAVKNQADQQIAASQGPAQQVIAPNGKEISH